MRSSWTCRCIVSQTLAISAAALLAGCEQDSEPTAARSPEVKPQLTTERQRLLKTQLERLSTIPMLLAAEQLDVTTIQKKKVDRDDKDGNDRGRKRRNDVPVANHPVAHENEPTVTSNPKRKSRLVAGNHFITEETVRCEARRSSDGGRSWSPPVLMPQLTPASSCSDPVLTYSPDGRRVFYAYMDLKFAGPPSFFSDFDIVVSYSDNDGRTWIGPVIALDGVLGVYDYDKPWIATPLGRDGDDDEDDDDEGDDDERGKAGGDDDKDKNYVYVTATRFDASGAGDCRIDFTRSTNGGTVYEAPQTLELSPACDPVVQGSRPSGGTRGKVLVAWYHSGFDGWLSGSFNIRTRYSPNFGASFGSLVNAVSDLSEAPFWKGPFVCYERWWTVMMPDVELDSRDRAHIGYAHDPVFGSGTAEEGDVRYIKSPGPPYTSWSAPITVNDDGTVSAQGWIALEVSGKPYAVWVDSRIPTAASQECEGDVQNLIYNTFSSELKDGRWSRNVRVSDESSRSDFIFTGDYIDLTPSTKGLFAIWTDRRDKMTIFDFEDDIWGSPVR